MRLRFFVLVLIVLAAQFAAAGSRVSAALPDVGDYDGRPIASIEVVIEGSPADAAAQAEMTTLLTLKAGDEYRAVSVRESLKALFDSGMVASARVEVTEVGGALPAQTAGARNLAPIRVRFIVRRTQRVSEVVIDLGAVPPGASVTEDEMRARLNMLEPGSPLLESRLRTNADLIQVYLRDRGFFRAEVEPSVQQDTRDPSGTRAIVTFRVRLGEQARMNAPLIRIQGFDPQRVLPTLKLQQGAPFSRQTLADDLNRIRQAIIAQGYLAPEIDSRVSYDSQNNRIGVTFEGGVGPKVDVQVRGYELREKKQRELLPVKREGTIDLGAIEEGARRLRNRIQQAGYFFAQVTPICTVTPPTKTITSNGTNETCQSLNPDELTGHNVLIVYDIELGRRFKLTDIRISGTNKLTIEDVKPELRTQEASPLGIIPILGYGRGYTSRELLDQDRRMIEARMRDLGYRRAVVDVRQGASLNGENLIITFNVTEGPLTRVADVEVRGNKIYTDAQVRDQLEWTVTGGPFSRSASRLDADRIVNLYAKEGYFDSQVDFSIVELPKKTDAGKVVEEQVKVVYTIKEGDKVYIASIRVNGNVLTKREAILNAIPLFEGEVLRLDKLTESERILYETDAFRQVIIRTEAAGETASGFKKRDVIIDVEELKPRIREYGGGYSTDNGPLGFFDIRNVNLFGELKQGAARARMSKRQQLLRFEYFDPRFRRYGENQFMPLAISMQYQRDSTITRFFRTTIDRGNLGIVQRLDEKGQPINEFGERVGEPTINRFTFNLETQRVLDRSTRSILFVRYNYEDVRLYNIESLLLAPVLRPDRAIRLSRFGAAFVRDTRERCDANNTRFAAQQRATQPGTNGTRCEYSATDATNGDFLTVDYGLALRQLGSSLSFNKFFGNYRRYYRVHKARGAVLAGSVTLGLANVFNATDRNDDGVIDDIDKTLPISERFFSGGSTSLRGFGYEEAGPRETIVPVGQFRDRQGKPVELNPFLVPAGGNAVAVINLEARIPLVKSFQIVPFYDGGNVYRFASELFGRKPAEQQQIADEMERIRRSNLRANWTNTVGLGVRIRTPIGGALAIDYAILLDPPEFLVPQAPGFAPVTTRLKNNQLHFRFTQTF